MTFKGLYYSDYYDEYSGSVVIPSTVTYNGTTYPVTSIGDYAFYDCNGLTCIDIPNSITAIGDKAYLSAEIQYNLFESANIQLEVPYRYNQKDWKPFHKPLQFHNTSTRLITSPSAGSSMRSLDSANG